MLTSRLTNQSKGNYVAVWQKIDHKSIHMMWHCVNSNWLKTAWLHVYYIFHQIYVTYLFYLCSILNISSASMQKGLSTSHLYTQFDPFALKLTISALESNVRKEFIIFPVTLFSASRVHTSINFLLHRESARTSSIDFKCFAVLKAWLGTRNTWLASVMASVVILEPSVPMPLLQVSFQNC